MISVDNFIIYLTIHILLLTKKNHALEG